MDIGESILTRFARGVNKDLICNYLRDLSPLDIVTDLRSDPEDPVQWELGQMGKIQSNQWLLQRRRVVETIVACWATDDDFLRQLKLRRLVRIAMQLGYADVAQEFLRYTQGPEVDTLALATYNALYGPFRGTVLIANRQLRDIAHALVWAGLREPLELLSQLYDKSSIKKSRTLLIRQAARMNRVDIMRVLIDYLGKPAVGDEFAKEAVRDDWSNDVFSYLLSIYKIEDWVALKLRILDNDDIEKYLGLPGHWRTSVNEDIRYVFEISSERIFQHLLPLVHSFEWINEAFAASHTLRLGEAGIGGVARMVDAITERPGFDPSRDVNLFLIDIISRAHGFAYVFMFLLVREVRDVYTREQLRELADIWRPVNQDYHDAIEDIIIRNKLLEQYQLHDEDDVAEPPAKMLKDPMTLNFYT